MHDIFRRKNSPVTEPGRQLPRQVRQYGQYRASLRGAIKMSNGNCPNQSEDTDRLVGRDTMRPNDPNIRLGMLGLQPLMCTGLLLKVLSGNAADTVLSGYSDMQS